MVTRIRQSIGTLRGNRGRPFSDIAAGSLHQNNLLKNIRDLLSSPFFLVSCCQRSCHPEYGSSGASLTVWWGACDLEDYICELWNPFRWLPELLCRELPCIDYSGLGYRGKLTRPPDQYLVHVYVLINSAHIIIAHIQAVRSGIPRNSIMHLISLQMSAMHWCHNTLFYHISRPVSAITNVPSVSPTMYLAIHAERS